MSAAPSRFDGAECSIGRETRGEKPLLVVLSAGNNEARDRTLTSSLRALGYRVSAGSAQFGPIARGALAPAAILVVAREADGAENCFSQAAALDPSGAIPILLCAPVDVVRNLPRGRFDDFLLDPFTSGELSERVRLLTEVVPVNPPRELLAVDGMVVDLAGREVTRCGDCLRLTPLEFNLLAFFMAHPRRALRRAQLAAVWGTVDPDSRTIDVHVRRLRYKIGDRGTLLQTVRAVGYKLAADVHPLSRQALL